MNKSFTTLMAAAALAASLSAALPAEARGPFGLPVPPPPPLPGLRVLPPPFPLPPLPPPPFWTGPVHGAPVWVPDRYYGDWIYTGGRWRHHPYRHGTWQRGHAGEWGGRGEHRGDRHGR
jgi:hypothetical protein